MMVIVSAKTEFVVHFSYLWNGALINDKILKHSKNDTMQCLLKAALNRLECWQMLWKNNGFYVKACFLHYIRSYALAVLNEKEFEKAQRRWAKHLFWNRFT